MCAYGECCRLDGTTIAFARIMGVRQFEDLVCWQRSAEFKRGVYSLVDRTSAKNDIRFCDQIKSAAASAPSNIAEGFGAYEHRQSARYARIAKSSLTECRNHLLDGVERRHWTDADIEPLMRLSKCALGATVKWIAYLTRTKTPRAYWEATDD